MIPFRTHRMTWRPSWGKTLLGVAFVVSLIGATCAAQPHMRQTPSDERIVTLYQGATDSAVALGITPIGVVDSWLEKPMYHYLRDELNDVPHVGLETQPNLEKIAWLSPDVIVATDFRHQRIQPLLTAIAPTATADNVFDFKETLTLVANATGREEVANALLRDWATRVDDFHRQIADSLGDAWPQKVAVIRFKSDHLRIYSGGFAGYILDELGFSQHWSSHPLWQQLEAVKHQRVFEVDPVNWMMGGGILAANAMLDDLYRHYGLEGLEQRDALASRQETQDAR